MCGANFLSMGSCVLSAVVFWACVSVSSSFFLFFIEVLCPEWWHVLFLVVDKARKTRFMSVALFSNDVLYFLENLCIKMIWNWNLCRVLQFLPGLWVCVPCFYHYKSDGFYCFLFLVESSVLIDENIFLWPELKNQVISKFYTFFLACLFLCLISKLIFFIKR